MKVRKWFALHAGLLAAGVVLGFSSGALGAVIPLSALLAPGATTPSADGSILFGEFSYIPTVNAPPANAINIITDVSNPKGLWIQGPFSVVNGDELDALLGFVASVTAPDLSVEFVGAEMEILVSDAHGYKAGPPSSRSHALITESIKSSPTNSPATQLTVFDGADDGPGPDLKLDSESLAGFGREIRVLKDISVRSVFVDGQATFAHVSLFSQNFQIPEPTTGLLLLSLAAAVLRRR